MKHISQILPTAIKELSKGQTITAPSPAPSSPDKQRRWLDKWLQLQSHHPEIIRLENSAYVFCVGYKGSPDIGKRMVIYGGSGNGKSHTGKKIVSWANKIAMNLPTVPVGTGTQMKVPDAIFCHWPSIVDGFKDGQWDLLDYLEASLLVIDDIGAEHDPSGVGKQKLYMMLEHRAKKWTVITTNFPPTEWENKFEIRTSDRLMRNCDLVDMSNVPSFVTVV